MYDDKSYIGYFLNILNLGVGLITGIVSIATYGNTKSWKDVSILIGGFLIVSLIITSFRIFKDKRKFKFEYDKLNKQHEDLKQEKRNIDEKFDKQSIQYGKNINELNNHKQVTHVVEMLVNSSSPKTREGKDIISNLKYSVENKLKDSE